MTIKEVEERTGLTRSNIRFYEKEGLIEPSRNDNNGYRDYSEKDVETIKKIAYLRTLEISIEDIHHIIADKVSLTEVIEKQTLIIKGQIDGLHKAKAMCEKMMEDGDVSFDELRVEKYVTDLQSYWDDNKTIFKPDSVSFFYLWGSLITWIVITSLCMIVGILSYAKLPDKLPIQWSQGTAVSFMDKKCIFVYPLACIIVRLLIRPVIYAKLCMRFPYGELITEYLSNYICFIALSLELFSILFVFGLVKSVVTVLLADTIVLIGILLIALSTVSK